MSDLAKAARDAAAKATGLRPDQVDAAVQEYRRAANALHEEPEWRSLMHVSMSDGGGIGQYGDPRGQTHVTLQIETGPGGKDGVKVYVLNDKPFDSFGEARAAELLSAPSKSLKQGGGDV